MSMEIEINGKYYEPIPQPDNKSSKTTKRFSSIMALAQVTMASAMYANGYGNTYSRKYPVVNLIDEFTLIQQKKSKLSRHDRDWVVQQFNKKFKQI